MLGTKQILEHKYEKNKHLFRKFKKFLKTLERAIMNALCFIIPKIFLFILFPHFQLIFWGSFK